MQTQERRAYIPWAEPRIHSETIVLPYYKYIRNIYKRLCSIWFFFLKTDHNESDNVVTRSSEWKTSWWNSSLNGSLVGQLTPLFAVNNKPQTLIELSGLSRLTPLTRMQSLAGLIIDQNNSILNQSPATSDMVTRQGARIASDPSVPGQTIS